MQPRAERCRGDDASNPLASSIVPALLRTERVGWDGTCFVKFKGGIKEQVASCAETFLISHQLHFDTLVRQH